MTKEYVDGLAEESYRQKATAKDQLIEDIFTSKDFATKSVDEHSLARELESRPDIQAKLASVTGYTPSKWLLELELEQVEKRRENCKVTIPVAPATPTSSSYLRAANSGLMGLCFSGGGIRSASFNLGILQGLAELKLLRCFDYLSSVSGGGYIHQWLAAWSMRRDFEEVSKQLIPLPEENNPGTHPEPIRWLRRYTNYLTPQVGLLSADTWVAVATWLRNTLLNQLILVSGLLFGVLLPHIATFPSLIPSTGRWAAIVIVTICFLSLLAWNDVARNLVVLRGLGPEQEKGLGQGGVQRWIVLPLLVASFLLTLLFPTISSATFGIDLTAVFLGSTAILLVFGLVIVYRGGAPLSFLKSHQDSSKFKSVKQFWDQKLKRVEYVKFGIVLLGFVMAALIAAICGAGWIVGSMVFVAKIEAYTGCLWWRSVLVLLPPLILAGPLFTMLFLLGLLGRTFKDERREWLSRLAAWVTLYSLGWVLAFGFSLFGYTAFLFLKTKVIAGIPVLVTWIGTSLGGLLAGKNSKSNGATDDKAPSNFGKIELFAIVGPYAFIAGMAVLLATVAEVILMHTLPAGKFAATATFLVPMAICALFGWRVDINEFSMHAFYRNRLARCYLGASNPDRHPNPFTGFDEEDTKIAVSELLPGDKDKKGYCGPFPIFCTALNLTFGEDLAWQERKAASFAITPLYSGYDVGWTAARGKSKLRFNGFVKTASYAYPSPGIHISTAVAISGAAVSPNWGYHSNPATAFLLTVFNARLGWWLRNPRKLSETGTKLNSDKHPSASPGFSLYALISELLGQSDDTSDYVYLTDGGHFDNMGLYELVRRRCRFIVICDSEEDGKVRFSGIGMAIRKCRIDFGAEINLDLRPLEHVGDTQLSTSHCVTGTIRYPEDPERVGIVVYIKSSLTGDEPSDVLNYKKEHPSFPHDSTANQWFTESQFESYRRLGHHVAQSVLEPAGPVNLVCESLKGRSDYFENLYHIWWPPTPEMDRYGTAHTARYVELLEQVRTDKNLSGFFDMLFVPGDGNWKKGRSDKEIAYAVSYSYQLIEFMWMVFMQLDLVLPEKSEHPHARGWRLMFQEWATIDVVREGWLKYRCTFSRRFRNFVEDARIGLPVPEDSAACEPKAPGH
ncbi:MAG TPA: patatin-like phospholipase family protein [Candidatus Acidoferrum sp.]|nr:patatin-like phospholipase family protein [Candidatus Acidoferrum sp.]